MKIPESPPSQRDYMDRVFKPRVEAADYRQAFPWVEYPQKPFDARGRYLHWEDLKHKAPPPGFTSEQYWIATKLARRYIAEELPFKCDQGRPFKYCPISTVTNDLLYISEQSKGAVAADPKVQDPMTQRTYLISSLIEEAISSSQLEGASTTRRVAKEMIRTARTPKNKSEWMILNNYRAMDFMKRHIEDDLAPSMIFELHHILMNNTVDPEDSDKVGRFREQTDDIAVVDNVTGESLHVPPPAVELPKRLKLLCDFANGKAGDKRLPELIRAIVVHFMIGYDHPFFDGNGRVARALFFWMVVKSGFWLLEYVSISSVIKSAPTSYVRAYMHVETDDNDVTYFIVHQLDVIKKAIDRLHKYLLRKTQEQQALRQALVMSGVVGHMNHRQLAVLHNAVEKPGAQYTVKSHKTSHGVAYETARSDLLALSDQYGLLQKVKDGRTSIFIAPADIGDRIRALKSRG